MLNVILPAEVEARLRAQAKRSGIEAAEYASRLIEENLPAVVPAVSDGDEQRQRGTAPIELPREQLFTQPLSSRVDELPRWKPQVTLTRRVLAESEDVHSV